MLTDAQKQFFHENGYLTIEGFLRRERLDLLRKATDRIVAEAKGLEASNRVYDLEPTSTPERPVVRRLFNPVELDPYFWDLCRDTRTLDVVEGLIGRNLQFHHSKLNMKTAEEGSEVCWHQDFPFFPHTNTDLVACMFWLDDATEENGCMQVVPGTHRLGPLDHTYCEGFVGMVSEDLKRVDLSRARLLPMRAGDLSVHHCLTLHSSAPNRSRRPRRALIFEYRAADAVSLVADRSGCRYYGQTLRGKDPHRARLEKGSFALPQFAPSDNPTSLYELQAAAKASMGLG